jgi:hypothetical protein
MANSSHRHPLPARRMQAALLADLYAATQLGKPHQWGGIARWPPKRVQQTEMGLLSGDAVAQ